MEPLSRNAGDSEPQLVRALGLGSATALNMIDLIAWDRYHNFVDRDRDGRTAGDAGDGCVIPILKQATAVYAKLKQRT